MSKLKITLYTDQDMAKHILKGFFYKIYLIKLRAFLRIIESRLSKYKSIVEKDKKIFIEENNDIEYLEREKKKIEAFLHSDSSELTKDENTEYHSLINDRVIQKLNRGAHRLGNKVKDKSIKMALGGSDVLGFFARLGIGVLVEIEKDKPKNI